MGDALSVPFIVSWSRAMAHGWVHLLSYGAPHVIPSYDLCHTAAILSQSFLNLLKQNGRRVTKVHCLSPLYRVSSVWPGG